jgi:hypothetical protein
VVRRPVRVSGRLCAWQTTCGRVPARCAHVRPLVRSSVRLCDNSESLCGRPDDLCARPTTCAAVRAFGAAGRRLVRVVDNLCERQTTCAEGWHTSCLVRLIRSPRHGSQAPVLPGQGRIREAVERNAASNYEEGGADSRSAWRVFGSGGLLGPRLRQSVTRCLRAAR